MNGAAAVVAGWHLAVRNWLGAALLLAIQLASSCLLVCVALVPAIVLLALVAGRAAGEWTSSPRHAAREAVRALLEAPWPVWAAVGACLLVAVAAAWIVNVATQAGVFEMLRQSSAGGRANDAGAFFRGARTHLAGAVRISLVGFAAFVACAALFAPALVATVRLATRADEPAGRLVGIGGAVVAGFFLSLFLMAVGLWTTHAMAALVTHRARAREALARSAGYLRRRIGSVLVVGAAVLGAVLALACCLVPAAFLEKSLGVFGLPLTIVRAMIQQAAGAWIAFWASSALFALYFANDPPDAGEPTQSEPPSPDPARADDRADLAGA